MVAPSANLLRGSGPEPLVGGMSPEAESFFASAQP